MIKAKNIFLGLSLLATASSVTLAGSVAVGEANAEENTPTPTQASGWGHYRADAGASGFSQLNQINLSNIEDLEETWTFRTGDSKNLEKHMSRTSTQVTPILLPPEAGGHLAFCTPFNRIIALDPTTGKQRWDYDPKIDLQGKRPIRCRAVTFWQDSNLENRQKFCGQRLYVATHDRRLIAVDAKGGKICPEFGEQGVVKLYDKAAGYKADFVNSSSPAVIINDAIVVGSAVVDFAFSHAPQGSVQAYDVRDGKKLWQFDPIPNNNEDPAAATWPKAEGKIPQSFAGGANAWAPLTVDTARDLVFVPTGSASPDFFGGLRKGDNLYSNSVVALKGSTGKVVWHQQLVHHDLWDYDTPAAPMLVDLMHEGQKKAVVIQVTKQGLVFTFDRDTGEPIFEVQERPVPKSSIVGEHASPTQPFPVKPRPLIKVSKTPEDDAYGLLWFDKKACHKRLAGLHSEGLFTPLSENKTFMFPGSLGGANWGGGVFWPEKNILVVNLNTAPFEGRLIPIGSEKGKDHLVAHGKEMRVTMKDSPYIVATDTVTSPIGAPCTAPPWGKLVGIDMSKGEVLWESTLGSIHEMAPFPVPFEIELGTPNLGGAMMTAGGLTFIAATMDRRFRAFDTLTGKKLWTATLPVDAATAPMSYEINGKQYVVIAAGGHKMFSRGTGDYLIAYALPEKK